MRLTKKSKDLICEAASDIESGNYLLYPRSKERICYLRVIGKILSKVDRTIKLSQKEDIIYDEYLSYCDPDYKKKY